jgi:hypothetical protein
MLKRVEQKKSIKRNLPETGESISKADRPWLSGFSYPLEHIRMLQSTVGNQATQNAFRQPASGNQPPRIKALNPAQADVIRSPGPAGFVQLQEEKGGSKAKPINTAKAIAENKKRLQDKRSILMLQNLFNMESPTGTFDARTIGLIDTFQKANDVFMAFDGERGIITAETLKAVFEKLFENKQYNPLIFLTIDYYLRDTYHSLKSNIVKLEYDKDLAEDGAFTTRMNEKEFEITIGETAFRYYEYLVHTIGHEFEHAKQKRESLQRVKKKKPLLPAIGVDEFRAEAFNILTERLPMKRFDEFMDDAKRAFEEWQTIDWAKVPDTDADVLVGLYKKVRKRIMKIFIRFENSALAEKHRKIKEQYERLEPKILKVK